jgi:predicted GNAT superfamily acetyltransferase
MSVDREAVDEAYRQSEAAGLAAGVSVRMATPSDINAVIGMFERTWGAGRSPDRSMLLALDYAGNTVLIATSTDRAPGKTAGLSTLSTEKTAGAALGFLGWSEGIHLHSHMTAVVPWRRSSGVGYALKLFQRAVCLEQGITDMRWTFDPLIRRNAHFNLVKLGAEVVRFLPDFYGPLDDAINGSDRSDRFEVRWRLDSQRVRRALSGQAQPAWSSEQRMPLAVDFEQLRVDDPDAAGRLREESRVLFADAFAHGLRPELSRDNDYLFTADPAEQAGAAESAAADPAAGDPE